MTQNSADQTSDATNPIVPTAMQITPSLEQKADNPLLPKISFLLLLAVTLLAAVTFMLVRGWIHGSQLATAGLHLMLMLGILFAMFGILAAIAWVPAAIMNDRYSDLNWGSPFGEDQLPKQIIRPRDPEA